jgi:hypothetical protein
MWHSIPKGYHYKSSASPLVFTGIRLRYHFKDMPVEELNLTGKLDTGATFTVIPLELANKMQLPSAGSTGVLRSFDTSIRLKTYPKYRTELFIPKWGWQILDVVGCERSNNDILLGLDVCNQMLLLANWRSGGFGIRPAKPMHRILRLFFHRFRKVSES